MNMASNYITIFHIVSALILGVAMGSAQADYEDDVGYTLLESELGAGIPDGTNVFVTQVESVVNKRGGRNFR